MKKSALFLLVLFAICSFQLGPIRGQEPPGGATKTAAAIARWEADVPEKAQGLSLVREQNADWRIETLNGVAVAAIAPVNDSRQRAAFVVRVDRPAAGTAWLTVEYLDRGLGLISMTSRVPAVDQWGVARLNSGKLRKAWFRLPASALAQPLRINGLEHLRSVCLSETEPAREPLPEVQPAVKFQRPMTLVMGGLTDNRASNLAESLALLRNQLPLVRALGFNGLESYVRWNTVEHAQGVFDWSYYDSIVAEAKKHGLQWSPFIIAGPAYTLPEWFHDGPDFLGYECLEHRQRTDIQTIFSDPWPKYVQRYISEFGRHYRDAGALLEVNLGISGDYGEVLYPATAGANMGYLSRPFHTHNGYWAAGDEAVRSFRTWLRARYPSIGELNTAWQAKFDSFDQVETFLPDTARSSRQKLDFYKWYLDSMSDWAYCWDEWSKEAVPQTPIYQKVGGNGEAYLGADFTRLTRDAAKRGVGIRETCEGDNFPQNFGMTRLLASATRMYGARYEMEPAGRVATRGVVSRVFGALVDDVDQLFYYGYNFFGSDQAIGKWLTYAPMLDHRAKPLIDIAVFYPTTAIKLDNPGGRPFFGRADSLRVITDHDFVSEDMILDDALSRYKVLIFLWGNWIEKPVLDRVTQWVKAGGTVMAPEQLMLQTVEGDNAVKRLMEQGESGKGQFIRYREEASGTNDFSMGSLRSRLLELKGLNPDITKALNMEKPETVFWSVLQSGELALLNNADAPATVRFDETALRLEPYSISLKRLTGQSSSKK
jgi:hypothetical protein